MPIRFEIDPSRRFFTLSLEGAVTDTDMMTGYRAFVEGAEWRTGMNELIDLGGAEMDSVTGHGLRRLAEYTERHMSRHGARPRTAIYAPRDLPFGIARMYEAFSDESPEDVQVFRDFEEAKAWLLELPAGPIEP